VYPLFIEHEEREEPEAELPDRPPPVNVPKVPNADILSGTDKNTRDNIVMGRPFAGSLFMPSIGVMAFVYISQLRAKQEISKKIHRKNRTVSSSN